MNRQNIKQLAKERLKVNRWNMIIVALIFSLLIGFISSNVTVNVTVSEESIKYANHSPAIRGICYLLSVFVLNILQIGVFKFYKNNILNIEQVDTILDGFKLNYTKNLITMFIVSILEAIGLVLCVIPGIIISLGLVLVPYLLSINPELPPIDTIKKSWELMKGHKGEYFIFELSFIGWILLDIATLGILGIFYIHPYIFQAAAIYCNNVISGGIIEVPYQEVETNSGFEV